MVYIQVMTAKIQVRSFPRSICSPSNLNTSIDSSVIQIQGHICSNSSIIPNEYVIYTH